MWISARVKFAQLNAPENCCQLLLRAAAKRPYRILTAFAVVAVLGVGAWADREWLLRSLAELWIVSDPIGQADAVAVFGGGLADRPFAAAQYYRYGLVKKVLVDGSDSEAVLLTLGTPASAIETFGNALRNTHEEVLALRDWAARHNLRSIIVPTELFSTRRVRWTLHRAFPSDLEIRVVALDPSRYRRGGWWRRTDGITAFRTEVIKYLYYRLKY